MTHQLFSLIFLIALFLTALSGVPLDQFFPYGTTHGDTEMERGDDTGSPALQLLVPFPFFDTLYSTLWVNVNGAISFTKQISMYTPVCGPGESEYTSISPFWADIDISNTGYVFYRQSAVAQSLEKAQKEILSAFPNFAGIKLKWLLVATWLNVTDYPDCYHCAQKRNTFQAIITTDGRHSFAIFYYQNLTWTTGHADGGIDGLGGTPAQAGFYSGDGKQRLMIPDSCTGDVLKINEQSNVGDPGKWVFRVDRAAIQTAGCTQEPETVQLWIFPSFVYTITRQPIELVGPCVENAGNGTNAFCRFFDPNGNTTEFKAQVYVNGSNYAKFTCPTPFFYTVGRLRVKLHVSSGQPLKTQSYDGYFYTVDPHFDFNGNQLKVELETVNNIQANSANKSPKILKFSWNPKLFPENEELIKIGLLGLTNGKNQSWNELFPLVVTEKSKGVARVDASIVAEIQEKFNDTEVIQKFADMSQLAFYAATALPLLPSDGDRRYANFIVHFLSLTSKKFFTIPSAIISAIISTINTTAIANKFFTTETRQRLCQEWHNKDPGTQLFNFPDCPCTSEQADNDADFEDDPAFGLFSFTSIFHPEADHCIRSKRKYGARGRQQCCYNKGGKLLAGTPGSGNEDWGFHGYRGFVSNFGSHWNTYMTSWYYCCWDDLSAPYCKKYYEERSSKDCQNYRPKRKAAVIGDPHMRTFDGLSYTFNGVGEFWLLINSTDQPLSLQGRMEKTGTGSVVTALAMKTQKSSLVQIQYSRVRVVDIFVDQIPMDLSQEETLSVEYNNVSVSVTNALDRVYVSFSDGHTLELRTGFGFGLSLSVPTDFEDKTKGLFGTLDDNLTNDLRARNGSLILSDASLEHIYNLFGLTWKIREDESLFDYFDKDYLYYNPEDKEFHPNFNFDPNESSAAARELCGDNWACLYDFYSTGGNAEMANRTRQQVEAHETWRKVSNTAKVPSMCLPLNQPKNGYCLTSHFFESAKTQCHCYPGFEFQRSNNGDEIKNKSVQTLRCQLSDEKSVSWIPEKVADCKPTKPDNKCEVEERLDKSDVVVVPTQMSITDEYGFHDGNNTVHFFCAARGKNVKVFFARHSHPDGRNYLGNATEEDITRSEIEQIFDKEFVRSSTCITAKRLTIPFTNAKSAGLYFCYARNSWDYTSDTVRLKLERSGGMCNVGMHHSKNEFRCADGRQCISHSQVCNTWHDCADHSDDLDTNEARKHYCGW